MASLDSLKELLQEELKDLYDAEKQLTKALPKLARKATTPDLKAAIEEHLSQTAQHVERLEQVFGLLDMPVRGKRCEGMKHLIAEGDEMVGDAADEATRDAVMIAGAQKVEHYEIASYGTLRTWANLLGKTEVAAILEETLDEEKEADQKLTQIAEASVNEDAAERSGDEDEEEEEEEPSTRRGPRRMQGRGRARATAADKRRR